MYANIISLYIDWNKQQDPGITDWIDFYRTKDSRQQTETKPPSRSVQNNHTKNPIIGDKNKGVQTRRKLIKASKQSQIAFLSTMEPKNFEESNEDEDWL